MAVITREQTQTFELPGTHVTGLASPSRGASETSAWRLRLEPGASSPAHSLDREEIFVVLSGTVRAAYDAHAEEASAGEALIVAPGEEVTLSTVGAEPFEAVALLPVGGTAPLDGERMVPPWAV
jgi:quercetin dioxygenase-like cupin family protein